MSVFVCVCEREKGGRKKERVRERERGRERERERDWKRQRECVWERERLFALVVLWPWCVFYNLFKFLILVFPRLTIPLSNLLVYSSSLLETNHSPWSRENEREREKKELSRRTFLTSKSGRSFWFHLHLCFFFSRVLSQSDYSFGVGTSPQFYFILFNAPQRSSLFFLFSTILTGCALAKASLSDLWHVSWSFILSINLLREKEKEDETFTRGYLSELPRQYLSRASHVAGSRSGPAC